MRKKNKGQNTKKERKMLEVRIGQMREKENPSRAGNFTLEASSTENVGWGT